MDEQITDQHYSRESTPFVRCVVFLVVGLVFAMVFPVMVNAAIAVINTNDGLWDSNWGGPMRVDGDDAGVDDAHDIDTFWVNTDAASPTTYYFGVSTVAPLQTNYGFRFCIKVDCNGDGDVTDVEDKVLEVNPADTLYDVNGNSSNPWEQNSSDDGEFVGRFMEAKTNTTGSISWAGCMASNPVIKAEVRDGFCPDQGILYDETELREYDLPTAVRLRSLTARGIGIGGGMLLALGAWLLGRPLFRRTSSDLL